MKTDRELLELAARAAGFEVIPWENPIGFVIRNTEGYPQAWHPLVNDGDALRLAVTLGLEIRFPGDTAWVIGDGVAAEELLGELSIAAARRAIVRAAAAIGEYMQ